jgi:hypothetical protein
MNALLACLLPFLSFMLSGFFFFGGLSQRAINVPLAFLSTKQRCFGPHKIAYCSTTKTYFDKKHLFYLARRITWIVTFAYLTSVLLLIAISTLFRFSTGALDRRTRRPSFDIQVVCITCKSTAIRVFFAYTFTTLISLHFSYVSNLSSLNPLSFGSMVFYSVSASISSF